MTVGAQHFYKTYSFFFPFTCTIKSVTTKETLFLNQIHFTITLRTCALYY